MSTILLPPSPVQEVFGEIRWGYVASLELSKLEQTLLSSGEANPIEYTLSNNDDAVDFIQLLLKVLDQVIHPIYRRSNSAGDMRRLLRDDGPAAQGPPTPLEVLENEPHNVIKHFLIAKLCEVVDCLRSGNLRSISFASTFFINGFLLEGWQTLMHILERGGIDVFTQRGAAYCMGSILMEGLHLERSKHLLQSVTPILDTFMKWATSQLQTSGSRPLSIALPSLMLLLPDDYARRVFDEPGGIAYLTRHLRHDRLGDTRASVQQMYELTFCLWLMSFDVESNEAIRSHFHRDGAVGVLCDLVASPPREKVVRCALSSLRNLATCTASFKTSPSNSRNSYTEGSSYLMEMVGCGLMKSLVALRGRQWTDPDIVEDLEVLYKLLHEAHKELSRFDVYKSEVESAHMQWGLVHTEKFFRENARLMEGTNGDFSLVKRLVSLIRTSIDDDVVAIACYDLGEFVRFYPNGRLIAKGMGAREVVLRATEHDNPDVQTQALLCISKILVQNWAAIR